MIESLPEAAKAGARNILINSASVSRRGQQWEGAPDHYLGWNDEDAIIDHVPRKLADNADEGDYLLPLIQVLKRDSRITTPDPVRPELGLSADRWYVLIKYGELLNEFGEDTKPWVKYSVNYFPSVGQFGTIKGSTGEEK